MKPRVFISSVVLGFEEYRATAKEAVSDSDCTPILAEDVPSLDDSPRNACLDLVASCDALVAILGKVAGYVSESGKTVVEEEIDEALRIGIPSLLFIQDCTDRDSRQEETVRKFSDYIAGRFRRTFKTTAELASQITLALEDSDLEAPKDPDAACDRVSDLLSDSVVPHVQHPLLRSAFSSTRSEEFVGATRIQDEELAIRVLETGRDQEVGFFSAFSGYERELVDSTLTIVSDASSHRQQPYHAVGLRLTLSGDLVTEVNVTGLRNDELTGLEPVLTDDLATQLTKSLQFASAVYDILDEYDRQQRFAFNSGLFEMGYRYLATESSSGSQPMRMGDDEAGTAYERPRLISRANLRSHQDLCHFSRG